MAQPVMSAPNKLRIKLKGVPARVQNATIHHGPVQAVKAHLQLQDWRAAVEAFSKQGANGLPGGMLLDPWNEEAERQARQEVVPQMPRVRKRRADAPAEASLAEDYPKYLIWAVQHHKKQRSQEPKRVRKSPGQLSKSMQRIFSGGAQQAAGAAAPKPAPQPLQQQRQAQPQQRQQQQQQRQQQRPSLSAGADQRKQQRQPYVPPPRPPSPQLDDPMQLDASIQLAPQLQQLLPVVMQGGAAPGASAPTPKPVSVLQPAVQQGAAAQPTPQPVPVPVPADQQAAAAQPAAVQPLNQSLPHLDVQQPEAAAAAPQQLQQPSAASVQQDAREQQRAPAVPVQAMSKPGQEQQQQEPQAAASPEQPSEPTNKQVEQPKQSDTAAASNKQAAAKQAETEQVLPKQSQQQASAKQPQNQAPAQQAQKQEAAKQAQKQAPAKQQQEVQASGDLLSADESSGIATRLRRRQAAEPEPPAKTPQQQKVQKQAKGKQKQRAEASEDSGPPAKKARTAEQAAPAGPVAAAPAKGSATAADVGSAAAAKGATPAKAAKGGKQAAAAAKAGQQSAAKAASGDTQAKPTSKVPPKAAAAAGKAPAKPAAAGKAAAPPVAAAATGKAAAAEAKGSASAKAGAGQAKPEAAAGADRAEGSGPAAAAKPESPPSETSHQQPIAAAVPQQVQQLQPPLVPQLPQEQTAVSRDRSQCSLQQPVESPAAVASTGAAGGLGRAAGSGAAAAATGLQHSLGVPPAAGLRSAGSQPHKKHLLELEASAMTPAAVALGNLQIPTVAFRPLLPDKPFSSQEEAGQYLESMVKEARTKKHSGDSRSKQQGGWDVHSLTYYAYSALEFLRYWDACHRAHKQFADAGRPTELLRKRLQGLAAMGLLKQVSQLCTAALQNASNCRGQDVQKQALRMLLERLSAICQLRHLHSQREALSQHANLLKGALPAGSKGQQQQQVQRTGSGKPPARAIAVAAAAAAPGGSSPRGKQAFNKRSPDDSNTSNQDRVNLQGMLNPEQHSPGMVHGTSPGAGSAGNGAAGGNGGAAGSSASLERARMVAESTCAEHLTELLKVTDGMHQTVMRMQQFLESPDVLADDDARGAALHISTLGLDAGMFSIPRVVAHAEAALVRIVRSGRRGMVRMAS